MRDGSIDGYRAGSAGEPVSECPFSPSDPAGRAWRNGWVQGAAARRRREGTFDHPPEFYDEVARRENRGPEAVAADPVVRILGGYDEPEREPVYGLAALERDRSRDDLRRWVQIYRERHRTGDRRFVVQTQIPGVRSAVAIANGLGLPAWFAVVTLTDDEREQVLAQLASQHGLTDDQVALLRQHMKDTDQWWADTLAAFTAAARSMVDLLSRVAQAWGPTLDSIRRLFVEVDETLNDPPAKRRAQYQHPDPRRRFGHPPRDLPYTGKGYASRRRHHRAKR